MRNKKFIKILITAAIVSIFLFTTFLGACSKGQQVHEIREISFETVSSDFYSEQIQKENYIIKNQADFDSLWTAIFSGPIDAPSIDFDRYTAVAVFMGQQNTGGYDIKVVSVKEQNNKIVVYISETSPEKSDMVAQVITSPYHIVKFEKTDKDIIFKNI